MFDVYNEVVEEFDPFLPLLRGCVWIANWVKLWDIWYLYAYISILLFTNK